MLHRFFLLLSFLVTLGVILVPSGAAQAGPDLVLRGDARAGVYLAAVGRRSIAMGTEDGRFEVWSWPIKWMHDFTLAFRVPKYTAVIPARDVARSVEVRPEGVTITYSYETFTVRQHVFAPLDKPAVIMLLEVDAIRPMEIVASFTQTYISHGPRGSVGNTWYGTRLPAPSSSPRAAERSTRF